MRCPSCDRDNRAERRFCAECGTALAALCASCGASNEPGEKFCGGCGAALVGSAQQAEGNEPSVLLPLSANPRTPKTLPASFASGRYQVRRLLGEGARKRVYLAHDTRLARDVALAVIKTDGLDEAGRQRVHREAQAMAALGDHPHIVTVHDIGEDDGQLFIVSQYMAGGSVEEMLRALSPPPSAVGNERSVGSDGGKAAVGPSESSFRRKPESSLSGRFWTPAFAGVTTRRVFSTGG